MVQISAYVDTLLASFLPSGAVTALANAQTLYILPVSLFGMSISAAELPEMSSAQGSQAEVPAELRTRLTTGLGRIAFFVVPSAVAFVALGDIVTAVVYQSGRFTRADSVYVWGILAVAGAGLLATTMARLSPRAGMIRRASPPCTSAAARSRCARFRYRPGWRARPSSVGLRSSPSKATPAGFVPVG